MKKNSIAILRTMDKKIRWIFVFSFIAFLCFMGILYYQKNSQQVTRLSVYSTYTNIKKLEKINTLVAESESATRGYLLTKDPVWKKNITQSHIQLLNAAKDVSQIIHDNPLRKNTAASLEALAQKKADYQNALIDAPVLTESLLQKIRADNEARQITQSIKSLLATMIQEEERLLSARIAKNEKDYSTGIYLALFGGIFAFLLVLAVLVQLNRDIYLRKKAEEELTISENKYRSLIENAGVVVFTADKNGSINFTNAFVSDLTGYSTEELMGKHFTFLIDPAWLEQVALFYGNQFQNKTPATTLDFPIRTKSGDKKWVEQFAQLLFKENQFVGFQCMVKDITEKKQIEFDLNESELKRKENEYRLTAILDNTTSLIFIKDLQGRYIMVNKRFKDVFGLTDEGVINKTDYDFNPKELADHYNQLDQEVIDGLQPIESEELIATAQGYRNLLLIKFPLLDDKQHVFGISGIATDITERVQSRKELETALKHAEEAKELQEQFLANMSHEIRTPLNGIQGMTSLLQETTLSDEQKEFIGLIKRSLHNLVAIVTDVLDFSNIKAGKLTLEKTEFYLPGTLNTVSGQFEHQVNVKGLDLQLSIDEKVPPVLVGDPYRLKQILVSLVGNAVKFTKAGGIKIHVSLKEESDLQAFVLFTIEDTGIGIAEDKLAAIFEGFAQANMDISRGYGGAGLGLAISKGLVQMQGGNIIVSSIPEKGSVFSFYIPYGLMQKAENKSAEPDYALQLKGKRFLVVEDNEVNQKLIAAVLKKVGGIVEIANHGKEAVNYFEQKHEYDLIIMDLQMPIMDGYQTAIYIRNHLQLDIPIMAMTATALKGDQEKCSQVGMNDFMLKPFDFNDLYKRLVRLLFRQSTEIVAEPKKTTSSTKKYDLALLEELDDKESVLDVLSLFLENTPAEVNALSALVEQKQWDIIYKQAHKIKGAVAILQATELAALLGKIEADAKEAQNLHDIEARIKEVVTLFAEMELQLKEEQQQIQKELAATQ